MSHLARRVVVPTAVAALCALSLVGCGAGEKAADKAADKAVEKVLSKDGTDVDVDSGDGTVKIETNDGTTAFGEDLDLPDSFPSDATMPQADHSVVSATTNGNETAVMLKLTDPDVDAESTHLIGGFEGAGYTVSDKMTSDADGLKMLMFTATKGATEVMVSLTGEVGGDSSAMYVVTQGS